MEEKILLDIICTEAPVDFKLNINTELINNFITHTF